MLQTTRIGKLLILLRIVTCTLSENTTFQVELYVNRIIQCILKF